MRAPRIAGMALFSVFGLFVPTLTAQQSTVTPTAAKDPIALSNLTSMLTAAGWTQATVPIDLTATGTLTVIAGTDSQAHAIKFELRGFTQMSTELTGDGGIAKTVSDGRHMATILPDGTVRPLPSYLARTSRQEIFPFLTELPQINDQTISVSSVGTRQINGTPCVGISLARHLDRNDPLVYVEDVGSPVTVWVSSGTNLPCEIDYVITGINNFKVATNLARTYSDYRAINGVMVPFHQEESMGGQKSQVLDLTEVTFGVGLTDGILDAEQKKDLIRDANNDKTLTAFRPVRIYNHASRRVRWTRLTCISIRNCRNPVV